MSNPWVVGIATVAIIALSAFFVAVEFALLAARRHRLEDAATESRAARAALRSSSVRVLAATVVSVPIVFSASAVASAGLVPVAGGGTFVWRYLVFTRP